MNKNMKTILLLTTILIVLVGISCATAANTDNTTTKIKTTDTTKQVQTTTKTSKDTKVVNKNTDNKKIVDKSNTNKNVKTATKSNFTITEKTYSTYFDTNSTAKTSTIANGSTLTFSGNIKNKDFTFDNIKLTVKNDGTSTLYNTTITVQNNAKIVFDGIKVHNNNKEQDYTILLETKGNTIKNSDITVVSKNPVIGIKIDDNKNTVTNTTVNISAPSSDLVYNPDLTSNADSSGIFIKGSNTLIDNVKLYYDDAGQTTGFFPTVDGMDVQSKAAGQEVVGNTIQNSMITVTGTNYVYGLNLGRSKNIKMTSTTINVTSKYYAAAIQLFDAYNTSLSGTLYSKADAEAYGVYSTAMGIGSSKDITLKKLDLNVESEKAIGVLIEGASNAKLSDSTYNVKGTNCTAVITQIDWMGNIPDGVNIKKLKINLKGKTDNYIMAFYMSKNVNVNGNTIKTTKGSPITILSTNNTKVIDNYIVIDNKFLGNDAVTSDTSDTIIKNNTPSIAQLIKANETLTKENEKLKTTYATKISIGKISTQVGKTIKLTANVKTSKGKNVTGGEVSFKVNGKYLKDANGNLLQSKVSKGSATIKYTVPTSWIKSTKVEAYYSGNDKFNNSNITKKGIIKVSKGKSKITITPNVKKAKAGDKVILAVKHVDTNSQKELTSKVTLKIDGKKKTVKVKNGAGKLTYTIPKGSNAKTIKITGTYSSKYYNKAKASSKVKVTKTTPTIKVTKTTSKSKKTTIKGKILDAHNKLLTKNVKVTVKIDGKAVLKNKVVKKGKINLLLKKAFKKGYHALTISSTSTKAFNAGKVTTAFKV